VGAHMRQIGRVVSFCLLVCFHLLSAHPVALATSAKQKISEPHQIRLSLSATRQLTMDVPSGLCHVDQTASERERILLTSFARQFAQQVKLLAFFVECRTLNAFRAGSHNLVLDRWATVGMPIVEGQVRTYPGIARSDAIEQIGRAFAAEETDQEVRQQEEAINRQLAGMMKDAGSKSSVTTNFQRSLGLLAQDDIAAFSGSLARETVNGKSRVISAVWGSTLLADHVMLVSFYRPYVDHSTIDFLLSETRTALRALIRRNDKESLRTP
jgi:hypothetical protein